jgi:hypothetical protein
VDSGGRAALGGVEQRQHASGGDDNVLIAG